MSIAAFGTAPATSLSAVPASSAVDPIFAALQRERETHEAVEIQAKIDDAKIDEALASRGNVKGSMWWKVVRKIEENGLMQAHDTWRDAQDDLLTTPPTTIAGLLAFIAWLLGQPEEGLLPDGWEETALDTIAASIRAMTAA